ncbi:hypothetical protein FHR24_002598 [Wenyingzhuangia heitensis]|uniref:DUF5723 domain-containing protein n=1 Tax=Wenyingzhuangia heitensis TaxID=1487859 RepID=A0ABX0UE28_9FLAO|nr:DUF5723 family protein [Wenyingzhuangia heitensis]NIJ46120.1 hypothetical protein [Wenyingzhuangia heitensis]
MKNSIKLIAATAFTVLLTNSAKAQSQISFFHLGDYVQQSTDVSPVYIPKNSFSFGLPGVSLSFSNGFSSSDLLTVEAGTENTTDQFGNDTERLDYNFQNIYDQVDGDYNDLSLIQSVNILNLAFKRKHGSLSLFVNQKSNVNWQMSKNGLLNLFNDGLAKTGNSIVIDDNVDVTSYVEGGVGFTQQFLKDKLAIGVRVKYLIGISNGSTEEDGTAQIDINNDMSWTINTNNAFARTAGLTGEDDEEFSTANSGIGFDIGASYEIIPNLVIEAAVNDIGSITWKENVKEYYLEDVTNLKHDGTDLRSDNDVLEELEALVETGKLDASEREGSSYKTSLMTTSYLSASYKLANIHQFRATMYNNHKLEDSKAILALGYNLALDKTTYGVVGIKNDQGDMDLGVNLATKLGPLQLYLATDNLNKLLGPVEDIRQANIRFGLNFVFGYNKWL